MVMIESMQKKIDQTEYWDLAILDFQVNFFGDEVNIFTKQMLIVDLLNMYVI